ncbi:MAG: hypothetical protein CMI74_04505 [Candidatus Pelagibacter sp.]|nr:hypothetical protein [Candidatus Pelagibacter sp.]
MAKFNEKLSTILNQQLPEYVVADHPKFAEFLKVYYQLLESAEIKVTSVQTTVGILLETETGQANNLVLNATRIDTARTTLDGGDKILYEESEFGKFTRGETVKGQTSNAEAVILVEDLSNGRLIISAQDKFISGELIVGQTSNATASLDGYTPNPVNNIVDLVNFRDPDKVVSYFLTQMRDEFLSTLPETLNEDVDKRQLVKNIKSFYRSKGTQRGHELFFRLLFNEKSETFYPREQILKASDGQFDSQQILRVIARVGDPAQLIGRTITGKNSNATAIIENLQKFQIGTDEVTELVLGSTNIQGTFQVGEEVQGTASDTDNYFVKADITGIPGEKIILNDGALYSTKDTVRVVGGGEGALFQISEIDSGPITELVVDNVGVGYAIGDTINFDNTGTLGQGAEAFVKIVNGGFLREDDADEEDRIILEDETGSGDKYEGNVIVQESGTGVGDITDIFLISGGLGYETLPTVSITSTGGANAILRAFGNNIGRVLNVATIEHGKSFELSPTPPTLKFGNNMILKNITGTIPASGQITSPKVSTIKSWDTSRSFLKTTDVSGGFGINDNLTFDNGATAKIAKIDIADVTVQVASVVPTDGVYISERGKLSETTMRIQDSLYYQDFSYVLKVGQSIDLWRDAFKKTMHTTGFYFTGQVDVTTRLSVKTRTPVIGRVSGASDEGAMGLVNTLFSTIFGRRLGTVDDGTSLRPKPHEAGQIDSNTDTVDHFATNTRDLTLFRPGIEYDIQGRIRRTIVDRNGTPIRVNSSHAYVGPRYAQLDKHANTIFGTTNTASGITIQRLSELKIFGTRTSLDGTNPIFLLTSSEIGRLMKMNFAFPSELAFNADLFSNTLIKFDNINKTFDDTIA